MRIYNRLLFALVIVLSAGNILLTASGQKDIAVYFIVDLILATSVYLYFAGMNAKAQHVLNVLGGVFFGSFLIVFLLKLVETVR